MRIFCLFLLSILFLDSTAQNELKEHVLPGVIIRSFAVNGNIALAGTKGESGQGLVYISKKGIWNWEPTNRGQAIGTLVEDVQAVLALNDSVFLAGTWKNGLFRTSNGGKSWTQVKAFPASDIRSIQFNQKHPERIFAASMSHGILESTDQGLTWRNCHADSLNKTLSTWSLKVDPFYDSVLYALTFMKGIQRSNDLGKTWETALNPPDMLFYDLFISARTPGKLIAVGSNESVGVIYVSNDGSYSWKLVEDCPEVQYGFVSLSGSFETVILAGSWDKGAFVFSNNVWQPIEGIPFGAISGIYADTSDIVLATWGDGLYRIPNKWANYPGINSKPTVEQNPKFAPDLNRIEYVTSVKSKRRGKREIVKGYYQDIVDYTTDSPQPKPIYGKKKRFRFVLPIEMNEPDK